MKKQKLQKKKNTKTKDDQNVFPHKFGVHSDDSALTMGEVFVLMEMGHFSSAWVFSFKKW